MRARLWALLLVAAACAPSAGAADLPSQAAERPEDAALPASFVVALVPQVVSESVEQAVRLGTAPQAAQDVAQLEDAVDAMARLPIPPDSSFPEVARAAVAYALQVGDALRLVPDDVAALERGRAACASWTKNATIDDELGWSKSTFPSLARLRATTARLEQLASSPPAYVDGAPLSAAAKQLRAELVPRAERCLPPLDVLSLWFAPSAAWPTEPVHALVTGPGNDTPVLEGPFGGGPVQLSDGVAEVTLNVPQEALPGLANFTLRLGNLTANATLQIVRAPSSVVLDVPSRVLVGTPYAVNATLRSPAQALVATATVELTSPQERSAALSASRASWSLVAPGVPGVVKVRVRFPGTAHVEPSFANATLLVVAPVNLEASAPVRPALVPAAPILVLPKGPLGALLPLLIPAAAMALLAYRAYRRGRVARPGTGVPAALPARPELLQRFRPGAGMGVLDAVAGLMRLLRGAGRAAPSDTVREVLARVPDPEARALVRPFEAQRYGGLPIEAPHGLAARVAARVRAWLGVAA